MQIKCSLRDEDLRHLTEITPCSEEDSLSFFLEEAKIIAQDSTKINPKIVSPMLRALFMMRGMYMLGIMRGAEAFRNIFWCAAHPEAPEDETIDDAEFHLNLKHANKFALELSKLSAPEAAAILKSLHL